MWLWIRDKYLVDSQEQSNEELSTFASKFHTINNNNYKKILYGRGNTLSEMMANPKMKNYEYSAAQIAAHQDLLDTKTNINSAIEQIDNRLGDTKKELEEMQTAAANSKGTYSVAKEMKILELQTTINELAVEKNSLMNEAHMEITKRHNEDMLTLETDTAELEVDNHNIKTSLATIDRHKNKRNPRVLYGIVVANTKTNARTKAYGKVHRDKMIKAKLLRDGGRLAMEKEIRDRNDKLIQFDNANTDIIQEIINVDKFVPKVKTYTSGIELRTQKSIEDDSAAVNRRLQYSLI
jgi:hypothetical protein